MTSYDIRKQIAEKKAGQKRILDAVDASPEIREMTPEETLKYDAMAAELVTLRAKLARRQELEEGENDPVPPVAETRSRRFGDPIREEEPADAPAVHTKERKYSTIRAMRTALVEKRSLDGLEGEISRDITLKTGVSPQGFYIPLGNEPDYQQFLYGKAGAETRDLSTSTGGGSIFVTGETPLIEMLRNNLVVKRAGARVITDASGQFGFVRQTASAVSYWVDEGVPASPSNQTLDQVTFSGKQCISLTNVTKSFLKQSSIDAEAFVKQDLAAVLAQAIDIAAINGAGGTAAPLGILQDTAVQALSTSLAGGSATGDPLTWARIVALESAINGSNANRGKMALVTTNAVRGYLKVTPKIGSTFPVFGWDNPTDESFDGFVNGYRTYATSNVPSNLVKGASGATLSAAIFGNWNDLVLAQWGGIDVLVNPYTLQAAGGETISAAIFADSKVVRPASFRILTDIKTV